MCRKIIVKCLTFVEVLGCFPGEVASSPLYMELQRGLSCPSVRDNLLDKPLLRSRLAKVVESLSFPPLREI